MEFLKLLFKGLFPLVFFIGGIVILVARIPGWSLILGLPMTVVGSALLINTFDEIARITILPKPDLTTCKICGQPTPVLPGVPRKETLCFQCRRINAKT